jgi:hypothetical protein
VYVYVFNTSTVHQNAAKYTRREVKDATAAREIADPSVASMAGLLTPR